MTGGGNSVDHESFYNDSPAYVFFTIEVAFMMVIQYIVT
jgi:hypothetical protein